MELKRDAEPPALFFFPEVIPFAIAVVFSPAWAIRLVHQGYYTQAVAIAASGIGTGVVFVLLLRRGRRWSAWLSMVVFLVILWLVSGSLPESALRTSVF